MYPIRFFRKSWLSPLIIRKTEKQVETLALRRVPTITRTTIHSISKRMLNQLELNRRETALICLQQLTLMMTVQLCLTTAQHFWKVMDKHSIVIDCAQFAEMNFKERSLNKCLRDQFPKGLGIRMRNVGRSQYYIKLNFPTEADCQE
jgi:hypothetical protein